MPTETENPFLTVVFPKRIGRLSYVLRFLLLLVLYELVFYAIRQCQDPRLRALMSIAFVLLFLVYLVGFVLLPRMLDFGLPSLAVIIFFIPVFSTLLALGLIVAPKDYWEKIRQKQNDRIKR